MENIRTLRSNVLGSSSETLSAKLATRGGGRATGFEQNAVSDIDRVLSKRSFYFQKRFGKINLEAISQISIQHVQDEVDIELLQQNLEMIVFGDLESSDAVQDIDESFAKLFRLSQLTVEYLLSVQDSLAEMLDVTSKQCRSAEAKLKKARGRIRERDATISHLKQYIRNRQSALEWYKLQLPGGGPTDRTRRHGPGGTTAESSAAPSPAASVRSAAPTPDLRGVVPSSTTTAPIATLPPEVLAKLETIGSNEANMQQMIDELRQSKDSMAEEFRLSSQKLTDEISALKASTSAPPPKAEVTPGALEAKPQHPGGFGDAVLDDASPAGGDEAGWSVDIADLKSQITSLQESVKLLLEAKAASPSPVAAPAAAPSPSPAPAPAAEVASSAPTTVDAVTSPGGAPVESPVAAAPVEDAKPPADVKVESAALDDKDELTSSNHHDDFLPIWFEDVAGEASIIKAADAKTLKQCDAPLVQVEGVENLANFKAGTLRLDHWIEAPDCEEGVDSGVQCLNDMLDALEGKPFDASVAPGSPQDLQTLAHQAKLALDILVLSDDGALQTELKDTAAFSAAPLCIMHFKGLYYSAYSVEAMQEHVYRSMSSTKKVELGIAEEMGGSAELVALSSSSNPILRSSSDVLKALLTKDLKISFISTKSGSVISEEQGEDLMILHSHVSEGPRQSSTELEEEYEKLAKLKEQLDNLDHSNASAISELSSIDDQFHSIKETISTIP